MTPQELRAHTFVVRLWFEPGAREGTGDWRGSITNVTGGEQSYFRDLRSLPAVIRRYLEHPAAHPVSGEEKS